MNTRLPDFNFVRAMKDDELTAALIACQVDRILSDPKLVREWITESVQHEVTCTVVTRLDLISRLYDEGYWE